MSSKQYEYSEKHQQASERIEAHANSLRGEVAKAYEDVMLPIDVRVRIQQFAESLGVPDAADEIETLVKVNREKQLTAARHSELNVSENSRPGQVFEFRTRCGSRMNGRNIFGS